ncbi:hypothetical protein Dsin_020009 [Dipteronia sinensis]|uniref:DUF4283 domain-containing protein n=1 Tax=Dipteronia sinensis TaxID=43782 RepID=A0AAE0E3C5_9ROSI|nr:hypothetical protein Dsin_020009 [Dipteronia sinensis]
MEPHKEMFVFLAEQTPCSEEIEMTGENSGSAKHPRSEDEIIGRNDFPTENVRREAMSSFKSKLLGMSNPRSWADFSTSEVELNIEEEDITISDGPTGPVMKLSPKLKEQLHKPWSNALILKNMSRSHTLNFMLTKLNQKWYILGQWQLIDLGEGYFVARFQMKEDLDYVLTRGPWVISNQYLVVQRWKPNFVPGDDSIQSMPI